MDESNIVEFAGRDAISDPLTDLLRKGARELLQSAVEAELEVFMARFQDRKTPEGHASVVRNGHHPERAVQAGIGPVTGHPCRQQSRQEAVFSIRLRKSARNRSRYVGWSSA